MKKVYLAGAIMGRTDEECMSWRESVGQLLECHIVDPMVRDYRGREPDEFVAIVENDKADIDACDILLVNYVEPSVGTSMELLYAWERNKLVIVVTSPKTKLSPWLLYHHHKLFFRLEDAASYINELVSRESQADQASESHLLAQAK